MASTSERDVTMRDEAKSLTSTMSSLEVKVRFTGGLSGYMKKPASLHVPTSRRRDGVDVDVDTDADDVSTLTYAAG